MARTILHVDMDAFFVSVELRRRPELRGLPVVVGGTGERGVVAAASYEARRFGVHSAMPSAQARRRCPQAIFLPGDHAHYGEVSAAVFAIFRSYTPLVEGISLDEAFLDVSGAMKLFGDAQDIAAEIRARVLGDLALTCSVGIAPSKFIAKLASEAAKPSARPGGVRVGKGVVEVLPGGELEFLHPLPVQAMWGVGPSTLEKLQRLGVVTIGDLAALEEAALVASLGSSSGRHLHALAHAVDARAVEPERVAKSIGHEETYPHDVYDPAELRGNVVRLSDAVAARLRSAGLAARTITLKVRFAGFQTVTRATTPGGPLTTGPAITAAVAPLLAAIDPSPGVRLVGVSASNFSEPAQQLSLDSLFADAAADTPGAPAGADGHPASSADLERAWVGASSAIDDVRARFGLDAIGLTSSLRAGKLRVTRTGSQQWGPDQQPPSPPAGPARPGKPVR